MNAKFFVPYQTAKLLREKGYNEQCTFYYGDGIIRIGHQLRTNKELTDNTPNWLYNECISAPTYHEVVDWLYEKKICITCHPAYSYEGQYNGFQYEMQTYDEDDYPDDIYRTREEALNAAILKALEIV